MLSLAASSPAFGPGPRSFAATARRPPWRALWHSSTLWLDAAHALQPGDEPESQGVTWDLSAAVQHASEAWTEALRDGRSARLRSAALDLCGLGQGSTPAGDDLLVGSFHALWALQSPLRSVGRTIADQARMCTTELSAAWLAAAAQGLAGPRWCELLTALAAGNGAVPAAAAAVRALGHTSGRTSLQGFAITLRALRPPDASTSPSS